MAMGIFEQLSWLTTTVKRLCCAVKELQENPAGGGGYTIVNVSSTTYNAAQTSGTIIILVDAATAGGNVTVNLPTAVGNTAQFTVKKIDSGVNTVTIDGSGAETIDGTATKVIYTQYVSLSVVSNNTNWFII